MMRSHNAEILLGMVFYALVITVLLPVAAIYRRTAWEALVAAAIVFASFVPMGLLILAQRWDRPWAGRLFKWHMIACGCILGLSAIALFVHWRDRVRGTAF